MQVLVTDDFAWHSPYMSMHVGPFGIRHVIELLVALNVATTIPLVILPLEDILMSVLCRPAARCADNLDAGMFC